MFGKIKIALSEKELAIILAALMLDKKMYDDIKQEPPKEIEELIKKLNKPLVKRITKWK